MRIGNVNAIPGKIEKGYLIGGELASGLEVKLPIIIIKGIEDGPVLWINSTIHGDELNGILACKQLSEEINPREIKGTIIMTPISNPMALQGRKKFTSIDSLDMDQQFPGNPNGWFSERGAYVLFEEICKYAEVVIALHTLGPGYDAIPYTVYKKVQGVSDEINKKTEELAIGFGFKANCLVDLTEIGNELPGAIQKNMDVNCLKNGIPTFMVELGGGLCFQQNNINLGKNGIYNVMSIMGMIERPVNYLTKNRLIITKRKFPTANRGGFFEPFVISGEFLNKGTKFGHIFSSLSELEDIITDSEWFTMGVNNNPVMDSGEILGAIALEWYEI